MFAKIISSVLELFRVFVQLIFTIGVVEEAAIKRLIKFFPELVGAVFDTFDDAVHISFCVNTAPRYAWLGLGKTSNEKRGESNGKHKSKVGLHCLSFKVLQRAC